MYISYAVAGCAVLEFKSVQVDFSVKESALGNEVCVELETELGNAALVDFQGVEVRIVHFCVHFVVLVLPVRGKVGERVQTEVQGGVGTEEPERRSSIVYVRLGGDVGVIVAEGLETAYGKTVHPDVRYALAQCGIQFGVETALSQSAHPAELSCIKFRGIQTGVYLHGPALVQSVAYVSGQSQAPCIGIKTAIDFHSVERPGNPCVEIEVNALCIFVCIPRKLHPETRNEASQSGDAEFQAIHLYIG